MTLIGFNQIIFGSIFLIFLDSIGSENIDFEYVNNNIGTFVIYTLFGFSYNYFLNIGIFVTSPLYIAIGSLLGLPVNLMYDSFINNYELTL